MSRYVTKGDYQRMRNRAWDAERKLQKAKAEVSDLRRALWDFYDVSGAVGPVEAGSAVWSHIARVLGKRRPEDPKPGEAGFVEASAVDAMSEEGRLRLIAEIDAMSEEEGDGDES